VRFRAPVGFHQGFAAFRPEVAHSLDDTIRVLVKVEAAPEIAADDSDPDLGGRGLGKCEPRPQRGSHD
jgi:hypothetical protein